jgi:hypothetical protein
MPEHILRGNKYGQISTDFEGYSNLLNFYNFSKKYINCCITINFDAINFIDANLCAILYSMIFSLKQTNNLSFFTDFKSLKGDLNILYRNGFTTYLSNTPGTFNPIDYKESTIPLKYFEQDDVDNFVEYIERDFLKQRGLVPVKFADKEKVKNSYFEIFENVSLHAETKAPIFVCGQFFPTQKIVKFTLVDLGVGFLPKIMEYTKGTEKITTAIDAITWAIKGGSTKIDAKGGNGIKKIFWYCLKNYNTMNIITNDCYYELINQKVNHFKIQNPFIGTTIHLIFSNLAN